MRVSNISFESAYIRDEVKSYLTKPQQNAIYELGNKYTDKHIIAGFSAETSLKKTQKILLRVNDGISAKELAKVFLPLTFSPEQLRRFPSFVFHA